MTGLRGVSTAPQHPSAAQISTVGGWRPQAAAVNGLGHKNHDSRLNEPQWLFIAINTHQSAWSLLSQETFPSHYYQIIIRLLSD